MGFHPTLWFAIANGLQARLVARGADNALATQMLLALPPGYGTDARESEDPPGLSRESAVPMPEPVVPRPAGAQAAHVFAQYIAEALNEAERARRFDELVLVAPAPVLMEIEGTLVPAARDRIIGTAMQDLVAVPDEQLQPHLSEWVRPLVRRP